MVFNKTEKQEKEYLKQIISILTNSINTTNVSVKEHVDTLKEYKDYLWSNKDIDPHEIRSMRESILNHLALSENVIDKRRRLGKILDIPYFSRIDFKEKKEESKVIISLIATFRASGYRSLGIVCKNEEQAKELYDNLKDSDKDIYFLSSRSNTFGKGIVITSAHMAKGLEFDEVIIPHTNNKTYKSEIELSMLYVAVTRAMHRLPLTYYGVLTEFIRD